MEEYVQHQEERNGYRLKIIADNDPTNPRTDWDNATIMVCEHGRYNLGDENGRDGAKDAVRASRDYRDSWEDGDEALDLSEPGDLWAAVQRCSDIIARPLYLYDHSGITIRMSRGGGNPFSCQWDSGMVGFVMMTKAMILSNWMKPATGRLSAKLKAQAEDLMAGEVETYDMYLTGDVWGYVVEKIDPEEPEEEGEEVDACWGMFGSDYAKEEGESVLQHYASEEPQLALEEAGA